MTRPPVGFLLVIGFALTGIFGPWVAPYDPQAIDLLHQFEAPSWAHPLGTADNGVDMLSALLHGARLALSVGLAVTGISLLVGAVLGLSAGYFGRALDHAIIGLADVMQAFPAIVLNIAILALVDRPGLSHLILALTISGWVLYARIARADALSLRERGFVQAARALGAGRRRIVLQHLLPNAAGPLLVQATTGFGATVLAEASLSFLGLGPGAVVSWGALLEQGSGVLLVYPHVLLISGTAIALTVLGFNLAGDSLRDRLDPNL